MIRRLMQDDIMYLLPYSEAAIRILGRVAAYGIGQSFAPLWVKTKSDGMPTMFISLLDGHAVIAGDADDELALFLLMNPEVTGIRCDRQCTSFFSAEHWEVNTGDVMRPGLHIHAASAVPELLTPREAYPVLRECFGDLGFDGWYADVSHRIRHGCCRIVGFRADNKVLSCAMTVAESSNSALIGAVATLPEGRGHGFASSCVLHMTASLAAEKKTVMLSPKNQHAYMLYNKIGFEVCGGWANIRKRKM